MIKRVYVIKNSHHSYLRVFEDGKSAYFSGLVAEAKKFETFEEALKFVDEISIEGLHPGMLFRIKKYLTYQP